MKISLFFGTETGNAEMVCEDIQDHLEADHNVEVANLEDTAPEDLDASRFHIFVCSTYGEGDLPQSAIPFVDALKSTGADLSQIKYSIFGLGDMTYEQTFANGSVVLMTALAEAGAEVIGPRGIHDASGLEDAADIALPWADERIAEAAEIFGA